MDLASVVLVAMSLTMNSPTCPYCNKTAYLVTGAKVYPHRKDLYSKNFFACLGTCQAWVGCHPGSKQPLGRLANAQLRSLKQATHAAFDPLWQLGGFDRSGAYAWLAQQLNISVEECHIGMFCEQRCEQAIAVCNHRRKVFLEQKLSAPRQTDDAHQC